MVDFCGAGKVFECKKAENYGFFNLRQTMKSQPITKSSPNFKKPQPITKSSPKL
jgi:hypothetical protein